MLSVHFSVIGIGKRYNTKDDTFCRFSIAISFSPPTVYNLTYIVTFQRKCLQKIILMPEYLHVKKSQSSRQSSQKWFLIWWQAQFLKLQIQGYYVRVCVSIVWRVVVIPIPIFVVTQKSRSLSNDSMICNDII